EFNGHDDAVNAVVFIPTTNPTPGRFLATASRDRTIALWNISDPSNPLRVSTPQGGHTDKIYTMVVSPNGRTLISAGADQRILFWDISNPGRPRGPFRTLEGHSAEVNALAISNDGRVLASGDDSGVIILWDVNTGQRLGNLLGHSNWILELDFDPSGQYLASSSRDGNIFLWDVVDRERLSGPFSVHEDWVWDVEFNQDSTQLVSAGRDARIVIWDVKRTPQLSDVVAKLPEQSITAVSFSTADTVTVANGGLVTTVLLDQEEASAPPIDLEITETQQANLILTADGQWAAAYEGRQLFLWDVQTGGSPMMLGEHNNMIQDIAFSGDGQLVASVSCADDNAVVAPIEGENAGEEEAAEGAEAGADVTPFFLPEPICFQSEIRVWETAAPTTAAELLLVDEFELVTVTLNQDGTLLAGGGCSRIESAPLDQQVAQDAGDKNICLNGSSVVWVMSEGDFTRSQTLLSDDESFAQLDFVRELTFSPDNRLLVSGSDDGTIIFWDTETGEPLTTPLTAHNGQLNGMAFSPDGQVLATVGNDSLVALWDVATRQPLATELRNHESAVVSLSFSPDSRLLVTADLAGQVIIWRSNLETWRPLACQIAGRDLTEAEWAQYIGANIPQEPICEFAQ
ncbi:MAG: WD40 repeat domain-containing protein, partial [Anaerolineales bacterium]|nr:WD40 repeat domain-containing protein [Anaerolineales bacterium]